jgi:fucose permease
MVTKGKLPWYYFYYLMVSSISFRRSFKQFSILRLPSYFVPSRCPNLL